MKFITKYLLGQIKLTIFSGMSSSTKKPGQLFQPARPCVMKKMLQCGLWSAPNPLTEHPHLYPHLVKSPTNVRSKIGG